MDVRNCYQKQVESDCLSNLSQFFPIRNIYRVPQVQSEQMVLSLMCTSSDDPHHRGCCDTITRGFFQRSEFHRVKHAHSHQQASQNRINPAAHTDAVQAPTPPGNSFLKAAVVS